MFSKSQNSAMLVTSGAWAMRTNRLQEEDSATILRVHAPPYPFAAGNPSTRPARQKAAPRPGPFPADAERARRGLQQEDEPRPDPQRDRGRSPGGRRSPQDAVARGGIQRGPRDALGAQRGEG